MWEIGREEYCDKRKIGLQVKIALNPKTKFLTNDPIPYTISQYLSNVLN